MREIKQSTACNVMIFMVDSSDHVTGMTGLTLSVSISKNGGAFSTISPTVTERGNGWYNIALSSSDTDTLGDLVVRATATGADPAERVLNVVANVEADTYTIVNTNLDTTVSSRASQSSVNAIPTNPVLVTDTRLDNLDATISSRSTFVPAEDAVIVGTNTDKTGYSLSSTSEDSIASKVWSSTTRTLTSFGTLVSDIWNYSTRTLTDFSTSLAQSVWDVLESAISVVNSIGVKLKTNVDATISSRASQSSVNAIPTNPVLTTDTRLDNLDATISSRSTFDPATDTVTVGTNNDKNNYNLSATAIDAILDEVVEGSLTMRQVLRVFLSMLAGKCSGGGTTTISFRDVADTKDRIVMVVDSNGNRTSITLDGS